MNRRQFVIALAVALWAGPRAVAALIERERQRQLERERTELIIRQLRYQAQQALAAMQQKLLEQMWGNPPYGRSFMDAITSSSVHELHTSRAYGWNVSG